ncbi:uncharacterized protein CDAR_606641 [Caerostris darwini]|uniref:Uncharacterized protein n=1 Tax=Caerostris darwini TaxID=1538125 RepID=A0AAV4PD33_9ARAC|nr:uncharacterized protein CDAR_606641 [Caerostris darwini]
MEDTKSGDNCNATKTNNTLDLADNRASVDDDRIECINSCYLDNIFKIAVDHVTELSESHLKESKTQFVSCFSEVFKNFIEENVTVKGLPWVANKETLSKEEKEEQKQETTDALLSKLSKTLETTSRKRKTISNQCSKVYSMQLKHERQNLKKAKIDHSVTLPTTSFPRPVREEKYNELVEVCNNINYTLQQVMNLNEAQEKIEFANRVMKQQEPYLEALHDTGYQSD